MTTLTITRQLIDRIRSAALAAGANECMGLLASPLGSGAVTEMCLLPATASVAHAEAAPAAIKQCAEELLARRLVPRGIWHSHAHGAVFHSQTDQSTMHRLLPAMAAWNFERPRVSLLAPTITAPDTAVLPIVDGRILTFSLLGAPIPGMEAHERTAWAGITISFGEAQPEPRAIFAATHLQLEGGGVVATLGIPDGTSVTSRKEDSVPLSIARVYSLVVNRWGAACAECLMIYEIDGHSLTQQQPCPIEIIEDVSRSTDPKGIVASLTTGSEEASPTNAAGQPRGLLAKFRVLIGDDNGAL